MSIQSRRASTPYLYCLNKHTLTDWNILNCVNLQNSFPKSSFLWSAVCMLLIPALSELHHYLAKVSTYTDEVADVQMHCSCCHRGSEPVCFPNNPFYLCTCLCAHKCTDTLHLDDYSRTEQNQVKREMKVNKRTYSSDIFKQLCLWQKRKPNKRNSQSYTLRPSYFLQKTNKDLYF